MQSAQIDWRRQARRLAWFTIAYNLVEALVCMAFGAKDGSLSLLGFGTDSLIETASGVAVLWRFTQEAGGLHEESAAERRAGKAIGGLLLALAVSLVLGAVWSFLQGEGPESGLAGTVIAIVSLAVMAWLLRAKMAVATALNSAVLRADAFCTKSCMWLSGVLLAGSFLVSATHYRWFDGLASLGMAFLVYREGLENWNGAKDSCSCADGA